MKHFFPDYENCLTNVTNSLLKYYGLETYHSTLKELDDALKEKDYKNVVLILYDGMGSNLLKRNLKETDFLNTHKVKDINAVFPPTTTASTTAVLSGLNPNEHGWLGWDLYFKQIDKVVTMFLNTYKDTEIPVPIENIGRKYYHYDNILKKINTKVNAVGLFPFKEVLYQDIEEMDNKILEVCNNDQKNFIYAYYEDPDHTMHMTGTDSKDTKEVFKLINDTTEELCKKLKDTLVIVIADHGHINSEAITLKEYPDVFDCLARDVSIEPRATSFKIKEGKEKEFEKLFKKYFGKDFLLLNHKEVVEKQIFGTGENHKYFEDAIGDYVSVAISNKYFRYDENGKEFTSMHAGITEDEVLVPLILYRG